LFTDRADEFLGHSRSLARFPCGGNRPFVLGPLVPRHVIPGLEA
jgi:hypothetical protein